VSHGKASRGVRAHAEALKSCKLVGVGSSTPDTVLSNDDLSDVVDTNDEWIATRTGIRRRHVLAQGEDITSHASASASAALNMAGIAGADVDMVILATSSPDDLFGSATQVCFVTCVCAC
jgi:3-oxoacyl-[acyl-carrier-protein] synthase III